MVSFVSQAVNEGVKKIRIKKNTAAQTLTTKTWYLGRVYTMRYKIGNRWIEYRQPIDL